jgi:YHS domain-containing protein
MTSILWIVIYVALFYFMFRSGGCCGGHASHRGHGSHGTGDQPDSHEGHRTGAVMSASADPVCGMAVSEDDGYSRRYNGHAYRFCSKSCLDRFESDPGSFAAEERKAS